MSLKSFKHDDWIKLYEGGWGFLTSSHWGGQFTKEIRFSFRPFMHKVIILTSRGRSSGWGRQSDRDMLGAVLIEQVSKNPKKILEITTNLKKQATKLLQFINKYENAAATLELYEKFWQKHLQYWHPHINVKYIVDYLSPELLKKYLPTLQAARLVAEPVLNRTEDFLVSFTKSLEKTTGCSHNLLLCLSKQEMYAYFESGKLPKTSELKRRLANSAWFFTEKDDFFVTGKKAVQAEKMLHAIPKTKEIKGVVAFQGIIKGRIKIILDPHDSNHFKAGDILVTGATRPEFLPIMHKASAFVTDAGGILSHAAITAREMKKPCVIGTRIATKVFKNGDLVEVDANKGIVRKL